MIRATGERDGLVREARRLAGLLKSLPAVPDEDWDEATDELRAAKREIDQIGRLSGSLDGAARPEERATAAKLRALGGDAKRRRRTLRKIRRRLLDEQFYYDEDDGPPLEFEPYDEPLADDERLVA